MQNYGMLLLAIYLIVVGVKTVLGFSFPFDHMVLGTLAVVSGVLLILKK
ncbi:MAG TPA: hypothetical protein VJS66_05890 [Burkholderiales bacterium]|nr:hypothetical protein [Burkholderiales bacterium]